MSEIQEICGKGDKPTAVERQNRVRFVGEMLLKGCTRKYILQYCAENFGISERGVDNYIKDAKKNIQDEFKKTFNEKAFKAEIYARMEDLYRKSYTIQDFRECRNILESVAKMMGISSPEKLDVTTNGKDVVNSPITTAEIKRISEELENEL